MEGRSGWACPSAAQRIIASLAQLPSGEQVDPPLAADSASLGAALRLSTGAATLAALIGELAAGLATTAGVLGGIGAGFDVIEAANTVNLRTFGATPGRHRLPVSLRRQRTAPTCAHRCRRRPR